MNHNRINPLEAEPSWMVYVRAAYSANEVLLVPQRTVLTLHPVGLRTMWRPIPLPTARTRESRPPVPPSGLPRVRAYPTLPADIHRPLPLQELAVVSTAVLVGGLAVAKAAVVAVAVAHV